MSVTLKEIAEQIEIQNAGLTDSTQPTFAADEVYESRLADPFVSSISSGSGGSEIMGYVTHKAAHRANLSRYLIPRNMNVGRPQTIELYLSHPPLDMPKVQIHGDSRAFVFVETDFGQMKEVLPQLPIADMPDLSPWELYVTDRDLVWSEWLSPFDFLESNASEYVQTEIDSFLDIGRTDVQMLHQRLGDLFSISLEETECRVMSQDSVRFLREFLEQNSDTRTPSLFLADSGAVRAQWSVASNKILSVLFRPDGIVEYVLFAPEKRRPTITLDHAGSASWQTLLPSLNQNSDIDWLFSN